MARRNRIVKLPAGKLKIHPVAQRRLVPAQLKKRMADIDLDAIGVLHGVESGDDVLIIDGQHRVVALQQHGFGEWVVEVMIHETDGSVARASELFLTLNARSTVSAFDVFVNEVAASDSVAVGSKAVVERYGLKVDRQSGDGHVACVTTIKKVWAIDRGETLADTVEVLTEAYGKSAAAFEGKLVEGLSLVCAAHNGSLDRPALIKKLAKYPGGASGILGDAKGLKKIRRSSLGRCVAETVVEAYNAGRREANRIAVP